MYEELLASRKSDILLATRTIDRRIEWEQLMQVDRLERALKTARGKLHFLPTLSAEAK
jgi:hypothetical protein